MKFILKTLIVTGLFIGLAYSTVITQAEAPFIELEKAEIKIDEPTLEEYIEEYATRFGSDESMVKKVCECESGTGKRLSGDFKNGIYLAIGPFQYHNETWIRHAKIYEAVYHEKLDRNSIHDQAKLVSFIFSLDDEELKREWSSYRAITSGGIYTFYSKLLEKTFTVVCK